MSIDRNVQDAISDKEFLALFEDCNDFLVNVLAVKNRVESLRPMLITANRKNFGAKMPKTVDDLDLPEIGEDRFKHMEDLGAKAWRDIKKNGAPVAIIVVTEAWIVATDEEGIKQYRKNGNSLATHKDRREIAMVTGMTIDGRRSLATYKIEKDRKGYIKRFKREVYEPYDKNGTSDIEAGLLKAFFVGASKQAHKIKGEE